MSGQAARVMAALPGVFAVGTLPVGLLALLFFGWQVGLAAFVIGWLLLVPVSAILAAEVFDADSETETGREAPTEARLSPEETDDPIDVLRDRYARGELDDAEFERGLETLVETEGTDPQAVLDRRTRTDDREREPTFER